MKPNAHREHTHTYTHKDARNKRDGPCTQHAEQFTTQAGLEQKVESISVLVGGVEANEERVFQHRHHTLLAHNVTLLPSQHDLLLADSLTETSTKSEEEEEEELHNNIS